MFDNMLTSLLQIVIVVDLLGAAAYFVLAGIRHRRRQAAQPESLLDPARPPLWARMWGQRPQPVPATDGDYGLLRSMLDSFRDGLR
jgi:hypothetical protein